MESNFNNRDFERFVQQNADQYRMFPSEKVWEGVHDALHSRRRWFGIGLTLLLITAGIVTWVMLIPGGPNDKLAAVTLKNIPGKKVNIPATQATVAAVAGPVKIPSSHPVLFSILPEGTPQPSRTVTTNELYNDYRTGVESGEEIMEPVISLNALSASNRETKLSAPSQKYSDNNNKVPASAGAISVPVANAFNPGPAVKNNDLAVLSSQKPVLNPEKDDAQLPLIPERNTKTTTKISKKKLSWQLYITPTISYRSLAENTAFISQTRYNNIVNGTGGGAAYYSTDVNSVVNHKPDLGFQLGVRTAYPLSKWFSLTGGLQLSVSKYDIKAYDHPEEMATIALTDRSVSAVSNLRNTNGYKENWLHNFYFSASLPIGAELKLSDGTKNYFGVAGTIQPTYVLDNRSYLISTDYKNYAEVPSLTRRWNMNTSFEVFSAHTTGKVKWRVGPQVRYQVMSSFAKNYPIKEHLFDFGLKLGIQLK